MIDHSRVAAIAQGGPRTQGEILQDFRQANATDAQGLHLACASNDFAQITLLAHRMKGACLMLGATRLAEACSLLSMAGRSRNRVNAQEALAFYDRESAELDGFLEALPKEVAKAAQAASAPGPRLCENLRFVVAEDHDFQRELIMMLLRRIGAEAVDGVPDGLRALKAVTDPAQAVDILVLDLSMPGMDGIEVIRHMGEAKSPVAVILNSALSPSLLNATIQQTKDSGVRILGIASKPLTEAGLKPMVQAYRAGSASRLHGAGDPAML